VTGGRGVLVSGNWKMHQDDAEAARFVRELTALLRVSGLPAGREVSIHPPFTSLPALRAAVEAESVAVAVGAQTCHFAETGPYTGEVSAAMLARLGVAYVIAGHSERRAQCGETDEVVRSKVDAIYRHGMRPVRDGAAEAKVRWQVAAALGGRPAGLVASAVIAYEPLWAIGGGGTATPGDAGEMCSAIRDEVARLAGPGTAAAIRIQYGGSVTPGTAAALLGADSVDGFLVGGASLDAGQFAAIVAAGA
jgi:triosephosphate isomerase